MILHINIKNIEHLLTLISLLILIVSCDEVLDEAPISEISPENFWQNNNDAVTGVAAIYDGMQKTYRLRHYYWGELRSDNFSQGSESASANNLEVIFNNITPGNGNVLRWNEFYRMMNRINLAIKYLPQINGSDPDLLAQAHAVRAYAYFDAIRIWGRVPFFTEPIEAQDQELFRPQTDGNTILNEVVIPDMLEAERLSVQFTNEYRFSKASIWALQAHVYMWLKDYDRAKVAIENILALNEYSLVDSEDAWQDLFLNDDGEGGGPVKVQEGPELILSINYDINDNDRAGNFQLFFAGLPSFYLSPALENKWIEKFPIDSAGWVDKYPDVDPVLTTRNDQDENVPVYGDWRYYFCREGSFEDIGTRVIGGARLAKYTKANYTNNLDDTDIVLYRYAGILLLLAEAENRLGNSVRALELVNEIRTARLLPLVADTEFGATVEEREDYILDERQLELLGEGKRWWDLRRTDKVIETLNPILDTIPDATPMTEERFLFPVFDGHLIENPLLEQTPGY